MLSGSGPLNVPRQRFGKISELSRNAPGNAQTGIDGVVEAPAGATDVMPAPAARASARITIDNQWNRAEGLRPMPHSRVLPAGRRAFKVRCAGVSGRDNAGAGADVPAGRSVLSVTPRLIELSRVKPHIFCSTKSHRAMQSGR